MSSKWERQVARNARKVNARRKRLGQEAISAKGDIVRHKGRSWLFAVLLAFVGLFYMVTYWNLGRTSLYWVTVFMYLFLAFIWFFVRRPFIDIGKKTLITRKPFGIRTIEPQDIEQIEALKGYVVITLKHKGARIVFSRLMHRYDTDRLADDLESFAQAHRVKFVKS